MEDLQYAIFCFFCQLTTDEVVAEELTALVFCDVLTTLLRGDVPMLFTTEKDKVTATILYVLTQRLK